MREPTRLTRVLQIGLSAYFIVFTVVGWVLLTPPITASFTKGERVRAEVLILSWLMWSTFTLLLTYGSVRRWRWTFWLCQLLLAGFLVLSIRGPNQTTAALITNVTNGLAEALLLVLSALGLLRYGPWAMKKAGVTSSPASEI